MAIGTGAAILGSSLIGAAGSLFGSNKAAKAQKQAAAAQQRQYQESKNLLMPYTQGTSEAQQMYGNAIGVNGRDAQTKYYEDFQADPGFQSSLDNALDTTMKRYSIMGHTGGGLANSLMKTGQNALLGAHQTRLSQLGGFADAGRAAASNIASIGQQTAAGVSANLANAGMLQGQGIMGAGNALTGGLQDYVKTGLMQQSLAAGQNPWAAQTVNSVRGLF